MYIKPLTMIPLLLNSAPIRAAYSIAKENNQEFFLVGGIVRDLHLKGSISKDIDFLVQRDAESIARRFAQTHNGTFFCLDDTRGNYRAIIDQDGEYHTIDFSPLLEGQINLDLVNRDFTINSIALTLSDLFEKGELAFIDPTGGMEDFHKKLIRVSSPYAFEHDPVRMLRAVRFSHYCAFRLEEQTARLITACRERLLSAPWERIRNEFFLILEHPEASRSLTELDRFGLLSLLMPELESMKGVEQGAHHDYTLFEHALQTVRYTETILLNPEQFFPRHKDVLQRHFSQIIEGTIPGKAFAIFIALLHDIGKPPTCLKSDGEIHFYGHERAGLEIARRIARRFKLAKKAETLVKNAIQQHMRPLQLQLLQRVTDRVRYRLIMDLEGAVLYTLILGLADAMATREGSTADPQSIPIYPVIADLLDFYCSDRPEKGKAALLSGDEIMEALKLKPGEKVGEVIEEIREAERKGFISTKEEALQLISGEHTRD